MLNDPPGCSVTTPGVLDPFMPEWDVRERHTIQIQAPAAQVYRTARELDIQSVKAVRLIVWLREKFLRSAPVPRKRQGFFDEMRALGWAPLLEKPGRLFMAGAACQPWLPDVVFTPIPADRFRTFSEPDRVKIAWTLEVYPRDGAETELATETRALATDATARRRFQPYWRWARVGIVIIRWLLLGTIRQRAERQWRRDA